MQIPSLAELKARTLKRLAAEAKRQQEEARRHHESPAARKAREWAEAAYTEQRLAALDG